MSKIIITGATGLVGSHLLIQLVKNRQFVTAFKRSTSNLILVEKLFNWYNVDLNLYKKYVTWHDVDLNNLDSLLDVLEENSYVYHCAAQVSFNNKDKESLLATNAQGTANVVNACLQKKVKKLCYISSVATLTIANGETFITENSFWKTTGKETVYAQSKYLAEMEVWRGIEEGLCAVIVNPSVIIGPHDFTRGSQKMIETSANGLKFYTNGSTGFVDANDVAKAMVLLMASNIESERFVLNAVNMGYKDFFSKLALNLHVKTPTMLVKPWMANVAWRIENVKSVITKKSPLITKETAQASLNIRMYDANKIISTLNFEFISFDETIKNTCGFYLQEHFKAIS